jgi:hypothetical protein
VFEIGNSLREARLRQGLEFPEIEQATKIRGKYLRSLEEEQFDVLPGQTYVKGFLRSYAESSRRRRSSSRFVPAASVRAAAVASRGGPSWRRSPSSPA